MGGAWRASLSAACALALVIVYGSIAISQVSDLPDFMTYAREWDERHELLLALSAAGEHDVVIPPASFDLAAFISTGDIVADKAYISDQHLRAYYGLDSITIGGDD